MSQAAQQAQPVDVSVQQDDPLPAEAQVRIAHVVSVAGSSAVALLERSSDPVSRENDPRVQIGAIVKIATPSSAVVGQVSAVSAPMPEFDNKKEEVSLIEINLAGEIATEGDGRKAAFRRGVASPPSLGDPVFLADREDLKRLYAPSGSSSIKIGNVGQDQGVPARFLADELLDKHFVVAGSTGTGKSCAVTCILRRLLEIHKFARIVILDLHDEYATAFGSQVERISLESFSLPFWMLNFQELAAALASKEVHQEEEIEILSEAILCAKRRYSESAAGRNGVLVRKLNESGMITVDSPAPFRLSDVIAYIDDQLGKLDRTRMTLAYRRLKTRVESLVADKRYYFMFGGVTVQDTMTDVLSRLFRIPIDGRPISVIDLSTVPHEILDVVISVISRLAFDLAVLSKGALPMLIVGEDAHRYAPGAAADKFVHTRQALGRIAKEGRKYALSLALVTPRPAELDPALLSHCGTAVAMRLESERDQQVIRNGPYSGMNSLFDLLPMLGEREAIVVGRGVAMPMRVTFDHLGQKGIPRSATSGFSRAPQQDIGRTKLDAIVARWRQTGREET